MNKGTGKRLLAIVMALSIVMAMLPVSALGAGREEGFRDVGDGDWFRDAVDYVVSHGIFNGTSDSAFEPNGGMTRAMMVTVLGRVAQIDPDDYSGGSGFTDVEPGSWYEPYVAWAVESGITLGVDEGLFAPNDPVTRAQMALFLMRLLEYLGVDAPAAVTDGLPVDYDAIPDYAREAVELIRPGRRPGQAFCAQQRGGALADEDIPGCDGTFDSLFIGELEVPPVVGGTEFCLVKDRGGTKGVGGGRG